MSVLSSIGRLANRYARAWCRKVWNGFRTTSCSITLI